MTNERFARVDKILAQEIPGTAPAGQVAVRWQGRLVYSRACGFLDPDTRRQPVTADTLFDLASVTKLFTTTAFMTLVEDGRTSLDEPVSNVLPEFQGVRAIQPYEDPLDWSGHVDETGGTRGGVNAGTITFRQILRHTAGLPAWRPLYAAADAASARAMALATFFACPPGTRVLYSDVGLILLGMAVERLDGQPLAAAVTSRVCAPLGLSRTRFLPVPNPAPGVAAPTELCAWRGRRIQGEVHDENAWRLGGAAGHAGLFSTAEELARFGQAFLDGGRPLLGPASVTEMTREQAAEGDTRRGIGFALWSPDPEASSHPFSPAAFGHTGFTGNCLWIDPARDLVAALLTNEVYNGRQNRRIAPLRVAINTAIVEAISF